MSTAIALLAFVNLLAAALLAGEEFVICYGVRGALGRLEATPQIRFRQNLIRTLRVLVPIIFGVAILSGVAMAAFGGPGLGQWLRIAAVLVLVGFIAVTLAGTVPINKAALDWNAASPPADWRAQVDRWERLDIVRTCAAIAALCLFIAATLLQS